MSKQKDKCPECKGSGTIIKRGRDVTCDVCRGEGSIKHCEKPDYLKMSHEANIRYGVNDA